MPSKSQKQHDFMLIACNNKEFAEKNGISQEAACEFVEADKKEGLWQKKDAVKKNIYHAWGNQGKADIRKAKKSDYKELAALRKKASKESEWINNLSEEKAKELLEDELSKDDHLVYFAFREKEIVGQLFMSIDDAALTIRLISVLNSEKGTGLAKSFIDKAISEARSAKCKTIELIVNKKNDRAIAFYKKQGFKKSKDYNSRTEIMSKAL